MTPTKQGIHLLLLLLICSYSTDAAANHNTTVHCFPDQALSLLQLKQSFVDIDGNLASWQAGRDCCHWEGVSCDMASGRVISLDLSCSNFSIWSYHLHPALFNLTSLRNLSLATIDFNRAYLPSYGFERLTDIIHLNLSSTGFSCQIPIGIARLKNLVTLDFSGNYWLYLQEPNFQTFMENLSNLRELHLDEVDISSGGSTWSIVLADSVPKLQILGLSYSGISGHIHPSFSRLCSLTVIKLGSTNKGITQISDNNGGLTGKIPEFFAEFTSLSILDISGSTLSCDIPSSLTILKSLKILGISTTGGSKGGSIISKLPSLNDLQLHGWGMEKPVISWIGNLKQLKSLKLIGIDLSQSVHSWMGNLTSLASLAFRDCTFHGPLPYLIGNLANLGRLDFMYCNYAGPIPSWIGNLTDLTELVLTGCNFSGPIPSTIGNLAQLELFDGTDNNLSDMSGKDSRITVYVSDTGSIEVLIMK